MILPLEQQKRCQPLFRIAPEEIAVLCTRSAGYPAINPFNNVPCLAFSGQEPLISAGTLAATGSQR